MAATNHTTNYNLPQYIGTDKPTYLGDWNSTMGAIDTQMKTNADNASGALSAAQTAQTNANTALSTAQGADTKANTAITNAATAQTTADNASSVASSALSTANTANTNAQTAITNAAAAQTSADNIALKLNLTNFETIPYTNMSRGGSGIFQSGTVYTATNADGSIGKIYGKLNIVANGSVDKVIIPTQLRPKDSNGDPTDLVVNGVVMRFIGEGTTWQNIDQISMTIRANGNVEVDYAYSWSQQEQNLIFFSACLLFLTPFDDEYIPSPVNN